MKTVLNDVAGGLLLAFAGVGVFFYSIGYLDQGTVRMMGPGMFPSVLGVLLAALGGVMAVSAVFRPRAMPQARVVTPFFVLAGVAAFAMTIGPFGLIPAILAVTIISSLAEARMRAASLVTLCAVLCLVAWLTFRVGLGLPMAMLRWPF